MIYNAAGNLIWSSGYDADEGAPVEAGRFLREETLASGMFVQSADQFRREKRPILASGIIEGKREPLIFAAVSIVRSVPDQDFGGTLVMIRRLNQTLLDDIRDFTRLVFHLYSKSDVAANPGWLAWRSGCRFRIMTPTYAERMRDTAGCVIPAERPTICWRLN